MGDIETFEIVEGEEEVLEEGVILGDDELKKLSEDLCKDYKQAVSDRSQKEMTWAKWRRQMEARPEFREKSWPYPNASNVVPPLSQIVAQALFGHLKEMYDAIDPPWYVKPLKEGDVEIVKQAKVLTKYYNICSKSSLDWNLSKFERNFLKEVAEMGTCYVKVPYSVKPWYFKDSEGRTVEASMHDGPELVVIPVEDLVYPEEYDNLQEMPWVAHNVVKAEYEIKDLVTRGIYDADAAEAVLQFSREGGSVKSRAEDDIKQSSPSREGQYVLSEFYVYFDADSDGLHEDLVLTVHVPSQTVLRIDYNEFGYRMLSAGTYMNRTFSLEGRGAGQTCEYQQDEIEAVHNVRNDNMKFANMRMLAVRRGTMREDERIYPAKIFQTDNPREDIMPIQLGEIYPSSLQAENMTMNYAREASGMSSIMSGFSDQRLGTRDTFRGQSLRMSQGQGLFSAIADGLNQCFSEVGMMLFFQLVKNRDRVIEKERKILRLNEEEIDVLEEALNMPFEEIPMQLAFKIRTSDVDQTFEAKRQNLLALTQLYAQYAMQIIPLSDKLFGPEGQQMQQVAPEAYANDLAIYNGATRLMSEVFKFFGEEDPESYVPDTQKYELMLEVIRRMNGEMVEQMRGQVVGERMEPTGVQEDMIAEEVEGETGFRISE